MPKNTPKGKRIHATSPNTAGPSTSKRQIMAAHTTDTNDDTPTSPMTPTSPHGFESPYPESLIPTMMIDVTSMLNPRVTGHRTKDKGGKGKEPAID
jgi:hypothetical protein